MQAKDGIESGITAKDLNTCDSLAFASGATNSYLLSIAYAALWGISHIPTKPWININPVAFGFGAVASVCTAAAGFAVALRVVHKNRIEPRFDRYPDARSIKFEMAGFGLAAAATVLATIGIAHFHPIKPVPHATRTTQSAPAMTAG